MDLDFDSVNPYQSLAVITAESPQELVKMIQDMKTPIKILGFVQVGSRSAAYVIGHVTFMKNINKKGKK